MPGHDTVIGSLPDVFKQLGEHGAIVRQFGGLLFFQVWLYQPYTEPLRQDFALGDLVFKRAKLLAFVVSGLAHVQGVAQLGVVEWLEIVFVGVHCFGLNNPETQKSSPTGWH